MPTVFILHGIYGHPGENWFPWLKNQLEERGCTVYIPHLPTKEPLQPEDWWDVFSEYEQYITKDSILIGHSLGVAFGLKIIEKHAIASAFFVASAWGVTNNEFDPVMGAVANQHFDWEIIQKNCSDIKIFHADNDPYLQVERAETLAKNLDTDFILVPNAGHFNEAAGYTTFPQLLEAIEQIL